MRLIIQVKVILFIVVDIRCLMYIRIAETTINHYIITLAINSNIIYRGCFGFDI